MRRRERTPDAPEREPANAQGLESEAEAAERRLEHSALLRFEAFTSRRSPGFIILLGLLLLALFGLIDAVTGSFDVAPLYLVPVGLVTFSRGRWMGALMAFMATLARGAAEVAQGVTDVQSSVTYWSGLTRFYVFMAVVLMIGPMRDVLHWQRELTETLTETNTHLEALNELRDVLNYEEAENPSMRALTDLRTSLESLDELASRTAAVAAGSPLPPSS
jgi:hypothetical protein